MGQDNLICPCSHPVHCNVDYIAHRTGKCILIYYITILIVDCIYNHRTTKTNQKYPSVNL